MSNHIGALLGAWEAGRDDTDWVLGTVYKTEGSAYRKAGAMMLINGFGQQFGLLSGGCLEADILRHARQVMQTGRVKLLCYDGSDEDDWSFQLGIGCGGKVHIMLQPVSAENDLQLGALAAALKQRRAGVYRQKIGAAQAVFEAGAAEGPPRGVIKQLDNEEWLVTPIKPEPHLLVIGGGVDARPLVSVAKELGWRVTLADPRSANARREYFPGADAILRELGHELSCYIKAERVDAVVIMSHNVELDAQGLSACQHTDLGYVALLGPRHRYREVLASAGLDESQLSTRVSAPAGLDIGGQLPESIALSILAECHAVLHQREQLPSLSLAAV